MQKFTFECNILLMYVYYDQILFVDFLDPFVALSKKIYINFGSAVPLLSSVALIKNIYYKRTDKVQCMIGQSPMKPSIIHLQMCPRVY